MLSELRQQNSRKLPSVLDRDYLIDTAPNCLQAIISIKIDRRFDCSFRYSHDVLSGRGAIPEQSVIGCMAVPYVTDRNLYYDISL